jgi:trehalose-6-phosphate hydrolase
MALAAGKDSATALVIGNEHNRDKSRSPMQWDDGSFAGFSKNKSWIKLNADYRKFNVAAEAADSNSILKKYMQLIALRNREKALQYGNYEILMMFKDMLSFKRSFRNESITVVINFGEATHISTPAGADILLGNNQLQTNSLLIYKNK